MKECLKISDAEWKIMQVLWLKSPSTATEIIEAVKPNSEWSSKTIHTLINRLVVKGAVEVMKSSPFYLFSPVITEEECKHVETKSFIEKVYNGSLNKLLTSFIKEEKLSSDEIDELMVILKKSKE